MQNQINAVNPIVTMHEIASSQSPFAHIVSILPYPEAIRFTGFQARINHGPV